MQQTEPREALETPALAREQYASLFDPLTQLPGWVLLLDRTRVALARAARRGPLVAVIVLEDVRRTSETSPDFTTFVGLVQHRVRPDDTVARIASRTFVVVLNDIDDRSTVSRIAQRILHGSGVSCRLGIGFGHPPDDAATLIGRAIREAGSPGPDHDPGERD
jgi:GGDEF domain-containing protein